MGVHEAVYSQHIPTNHICAVMLLTIKNMKNKQIICLYMKIQKAVAHKN